VEYTTMVMPLANVRSEQSAIERSNFRINRRLIVGARPRLFLILRM